MLCGGARLAGQLLAAAAALDWVARVAGMQTDGGQEVTVRLRDLPPRLGMSRDAPGCVVAHEVLVGLEPLQVLLSGERTIRATVHRKELSVAGDLTGKGGGRS